MYKSVLVNGGFPKTDSSYGPSATCVGHFGGSGALAAEDRPGICSLLLTNNFSHASHFYNRRPIMNTQTVRKSLLKSKLTPTEGVPKKYIEQPLRS